MADAIAATDGAANRHRIPFTVTAIRPQMTSISVELRAGHSCLLIRSHFIVAVRQMYDEREWAGATAREGVIMQSRMKNPVFVVPGAMQALQALAASLEQGGVPKKTLDLVHLRASLINGCGVCLDLHARGARQAGETEERLLTVAGWRDAPYFTDAERAALALTEAVTRLSDRTDPVPDAIWEDAARYYDERALGALILSIALTNVWNRLNVATRQVAGEWATSQEARDWIENQGSAGNNEMTAKAV